MVKMKFGSHLYGTDTPNSDLDYKGVFMPSREQVLLGRIPKSVNFSTKKGREKNTPDDVDTEIYSLHYFLKLATQGETIAMDMLHAPRPMILSTSWVWKLIVHHRHKFYTKNLRAFVGYARRQAAKYGIKGSRLSAAHLFLNILNIYGTREGMKLSGVWEHFEEGEHTHFIGPNPNGIRQYQVCGKILQETMSVDYAYEIINRFHEAYGARARMAAENRGIDWKAVSHALRAAFQIRELLTDGTITFPRPEAELLKQVKMGQLHFQREVGPMLDGLTEEVEKLSEESRLPEKVDSRFWDEWMVKVVGEFVITGDI